MSLVQQGDTIRIHYTGKLEDGSVFDTTDGGASLEFKVGGGEFLAGLENGVLGMRVGEKKTILIAAGEGYGPHKKERVFQYDRRRLPEDLKVSIGEKFQMYRADGMPITVTIAGVSGDSVSLDCNHPLAGKNLIFDVTLEEIL